MAELTVKTSELSALNAREKKGSSSRFPSFVSPLQAHFMGIFTRWIREIYPKNLGNLPSGLEKFLHASDQPKVKPELQP